MRLAQSPEVLGPCEPRGAGVERRSRQVRVIVVLNRVSAVDECLQQSMSARSGDGQVNGCVHHSEAAVVAKKLQQPEPAVE